MGTHHLHHNHGDCTHTEHHHRHGHCHHHHSKSVSGKRLLFVTLLNAIITAAEFLGGIMSNSLSLLSDAVHNLGDTMAIAFAYFARRISNKKADIRHTFGYKRAEILAAFVNASILMAICIFLLKEAYERWQNPEHIHGGLMLIIAVIGLLANLASVFILRDEKEKSINTRAAYLHLLGDTLSSVAVIIGGIIIWKYNILWIDPIITVIVSLYIMYHTWGVLREAVDILMQKAPDKININEIVKEIKQIDGIEDVHHLHLWQLNEEQVHFEAHINISDNFNMAQVDEIREQVQHLLSAHQINHTTLQIASNCCNGNASLIADEDIY